MMNKFTATIALTVTALCASVMPAFASEVTNAPEPSLNVATGATLLVETFDSVDAWEQYLSPSGVEIGVADGMYHAYTMNPGYVWGLNATEHSDVIMEVQATPMSPMTQNAFGVMCRADVTNNGDGYYFMIDDGGHYSIRVGEGPSVLPIVEWTQSDAIRPSLDTNTIRVVCAGDYLAMYANGVLLAEVYDSTFTSGYAGLAVAASAEGGADVAFDNLTIYEALVQ